PVGEEQHLVRHQSASGPSNPSDTRKVGDDGGISRAGAVGCGMIRSLCALACLGLAGCGGGSAPANQTTAANAGAAGSRPSFDPPVPANLPDIVKVRIETAAGTTLGALDHRRAPITTTHLVRYADDHR